MCGFGSSDPGSWNREVSRWNGSEGRGLSGRWIEETENLKADGFRDRKLRGGTVRRENGFRVVGHLDCKPAKWKTPGPGKLRCGTVRRVGGFRAAEPTGREAPQRKGLGPGSFDTERFSEKMAFGLSDQRIGKDLNGKVQSPDGVAPYGSLKKWLSGRRITEKESARDMGSWIGKLRRGSIRQNCGFWVA